MSERAKDSERLDWLAANPGILYPESAVNPAWNTDGFHDETEGWANEISREWHQSLREAIDAAMSSSLSTPVEASQ